MSNAVIWMIFRFFQLSTFSRLVDILFSVGGTASVSNFLVGNIIILVHAVQPGLGVRDSAPFNCFVMSI